MSLKNWSTTAASNNSTPPAGAPEGSTSVGSFTDIIRQIMADVRTLASSDTIASGTTTDIGSKDNTFLTVTGTTAITGLGTVSAGIWKVLIFDGALTFTHNGTSLILPGAANITTAQGDTALMLSLGSGNWRCLMYQRKNGGILGTAGVLLDLFTDSVINVKDPTYGATGDGVADDTAEIQAAIDAVGVDGGIVFFPPGTYKVSSAVTVTVDNVHLIGSGIGATTIINSGSGNTIEVKSLGGASATRYGCSVESMTIDGQSTGKCLYFYDVAQSNINRVETINSTAHGINAEMIVDCHVFRCITTDNTTDGILLSYGTKASVEHTCNAVIVDSCVSYSNGGSGVRVYCGYANRIRNGEYSSNDIGVHLNGGDRCTVDGVWSENNTTNSLKISSATTALAVTYNGHDNQVINNHLTGTGSVLINSGNKNFILANYIGHGITLGASTTATFFGQQAELVGALTDSGSGTIDFHDPMAMYWKASGLKRLQLNVGSTVDFTSDIAALRIAQIKGMSGTSTASNNYTGYVDISGTSTTSAVAFGTAEADANYGIVFGVWDVTGTPASGSRNAYMTSRATSGFTVNVQTAPGTGNTVRVQWLLCR